MNKKFFIAAVIAVLTTAVAPVFAAQSSNDENGNFCYRRCGNDSAYCGGYCDDGYGNGNYRRQGGCGC